MSLMRQFGDLVWICDVCGGYLETGTDDFPAALAELRACEWAYRKEGKAWKHYCEDCRQPNMFRQVANAQR